MRQIQVNWWGEKSGCKYDQSLISAIEGRISKCLASLYSWAFFLSFTKFSRSRWIDRDLSAFTSGET